MTDPATERVRAAARDVGEAAAKPGEVLRAFVERDERVTAFQAIRVAIGQRFADAAGAIAILFGMLRA